MAPAVGGSGSGRDSGNANGKGRSARQLRQGNSPQEEATGDGIKQRPDWIEHIQDYFKDNKDDEAFTPLHRAAWLGDVDVLKRLLHYSKDSVLSPEHLDELMACDTNGRMPVHVAALQGNQTAVAFLLSCGTSKVAESKDGEGKTALELLSLTASKMVELDKTDPIVEGREQQLWSLHKTIEITRLEHVLAARFFSFRHFWFLFIPAALITAFSAILSFLATSVIVENQGAAAEWCTMIVGALASVSVFIQAINEQLQFRARAAMHDSAAQDLKRMVQDLEFKSIQAIEYGDNEEALEEGLLHGKPMIDVDVYQEKFQQVMQACKSRVPHEIEQCFNTLDDRLEESLRGAENLQDYSEDKIVEDIRDALLDVYILAAHEAQHALTRQRGWPCFINEGAAIKQAIDTAHEKLAEGVPEDVLPGIEKGKSTERGRASLGELLVVRIAYFKGYLTARAVERVKPPSTADAPAPAPAPGPSSSSA